MYRKLSMPIFISLNFVVELSEGFYALSEYFHDGYTSYVLYSRCAHTLLCVKIVGGKCFAVLPMKLMYCNPMLNTIQARQIAANQPLSEKKITNMKITVTATFTMSGIVWAMKDSIFSIFCSIVF